MYRLRMRKIYALIVCFLALAACKKQPQEPPALVCTPAVKGAWLYANNKISVCAPNAKDKVYGWQELKWQEQQQQQQPVTPAPTQQ
jgi:hypothetical protein